MSEKDRGKVVSFEAFKKRREIAEVKPAEDKSQEELTALGSVDKSFIHKHALNDDDVRIFRALEQQGIRVSEAFDIVKRLMSICENAGDFNPKQFQKWLEDLQTEDIKSLVDLVMSLDERKTQTHPTYARAVFKMFLEKVYALYP